MIPPPPVLPKFPSVGIQLIPIIFRLSQFIKPKWANAPFQKKNLAFSPIFQTN